MIPAILHEPRIAKDGRRFASIAAKIDVHHVPAGSGREVSDRGTAKGAAIIWATRLSKRQRVS